MRVANNVQALDKSVQLSRLFGFYLRDHLSIILASQRADLQETYLREINIFYIVRRVVIFYLASRPINALHTKYLPFLD